MPKPDPKDAPKAPSSITDLLQAVEAAVTKAQERASVVEQTKAAFEAASQDHQAAQAELAGLQDELNAKLTALVPNLGNARVKVG